MNGRASRGSRQYETTLDRAGLALGAGSILGGSVVLGLQMLGGTGDPMTLVTGWLLGAMFVAFGITAAAGPLWLVLHVAGLRGMSHAALTGAVVSLAIFVERIDVRARVRIHVHLVVQPCVRAAQR